MLDLRLAKSRVSVGAVVPVVFAVLAFSLLNGCSSTSPVPSAGQTIQNPGGAVTPPTSPTGSAGTPTAGTSTARPPPAGTFDPQKGFGPSPGAQVGR